MNLIQEYENDISSTSSQEDSKELQEMLGITGVNPNPEVALVVPQSELVDKLNTVSPCLYPSLAHCPIRLQS